MSDDILDRYSRDNLDSTSPPQNAAGSFTPNDIFDKYDRSDTPVTATPSWQDAEALENLAAQGVKPPEAPAKPGRGLWQAIKDYPGHVLSGLIQTVEAPGNVLASTTPSTSQSLIPAAVGLAGLTTGSEFPKAGVAAAVEKLGPSSQAVNKLVNAIGPENVPAVVNRLRANPRLTIADASDPVRTMAQGLIDPGQPAAQNAIVSAVKNRINTRLDAANSAYTQAMGPAPDVLQMVEGLKQRARDAGQKAIQPALENSKLVDTSPVIAAIDEKLQPGIQAMLDPKTQLPLSAEQEALARFKQQLTTDNGETLFDPQRLHRVQSDIGDQAYQLSKSADPKDRLLGTQLRGMNEKLIDQIDQASGGAYRPARQQFADAKDISEAFESGFDTLKNRSGLSGALEDSPQAFNEWMKDATPEEIVARRLGTRADIEQKINGVKNGALAGQNITAIPYNQQKLTSLFGGKEAGRLIQVMKDAGDEAATNAKLLAGAKTAETQAGQRALAVPTVGGGNPLQYVAPIGAELLGQGAGFPGVGMAASLLAKGIHMGAQKASQMNALARNTEFAKGALASGPSREQTMQALLAHPKVVRALKKSSNALTAP